MINVADQGMRTAIQEALGHPAPFSPEELAAIRELHVQHAGDISEVQACAGLTHLALTACAIDSLAAVATLDRLSRLHVLGCPLRDASPLAGHPALEDLQVDFCYLQDLAPLAEISRLRRGRFIGNPIDPASWDEIRPRWQRAHTAGTGRLRLLEFGPDNAWRATRTMWDHHVQLCFGLLDGVRPALVRPGIAKIDGALVDSSHADAAGLIIATERGDSADEIFRRNIEFAEGQGLTRPTDFSIHRVLGDADDAHGWIGSATGHNRQLLARFINNFPDQVFFREDAVVSAAIGQRTGTQMPAPIASARAVLAGILPDEGARFRLSGFTGRSPREDDLPVMRFSQRPGIYSTAEFRSLLLDEAGFYPLAEWIEAGGSVLATRSAGDDTAIYELGEEDFYFAHSRGRPVTESVYRVFASYPELLANIDAFELPDGTLITARASGDP